MKLGPMTQLAFTVLAAIAVYCFVAMAKGEETRRACVPVCALRPSYAASNRTAPDFELKNLAGNGVRLSSFRGKTVVLNFWTTACPPCLEEMPALAELASIVAPRGDIIVLTVSTDPDRATTETTLRTVLRGRVPFPVLLDPESSIVGGQYGTRLFPETWLIDREGVIRARFDGARDWSNAIMLDLIDSLYVAAPCPAEFLRGQPSSATAQLCDEGG